jgi:hypothetical protein
MAGKYSRGKISVTLPKRLELLFHFAVHTVSKCVIRVFVFLVDYDLFQTQIHLLTEFYLLILETNILL